MNTLNKTITSQFYIDPDNGYNEITKFWKEQISKGYKPTSYELLSYAILRGKDYRKGFSKITNKNKLLNGMYEYLGFRQTVPYFCKHSGKYAFAPIFESFLNDEAGVVLRKILPQECLQGGFWSSKFPTKDAYINIDSNLVAVKVSSDLGNLERKSPGIIKKMVDIILGVF